MRSVGFTDESLQFWIQDQSAPRAFLRQRVADRSPTRRRSWVKWPAGAECAPGAARVFLGNRYLAGFFSYQAPPGHPDLGARQQHAGAGPGLSRPGLAGRGRRRHRQPAGRRRAGLGARPGHRRLGPAPQGIRQPRGLRRRAGRGNRPPCAGLRHPGRLHARADAGLRQPFRGSAGEYPSLAAAGLPGLHTHAQALATACACTAAPCISSRRCWTTAPSSPRAACRCWPATRRIRWPIACWKSSTGLFRPPCWLAEGRVTLTPDHRVDVQGDPERLFTWSPAA